jgi:hypothetical protein
MLKVRHFLCHVSTLTTIAVAIRNMLWIPEARSSSPSFSSPSSVKKEELSLQGQESFQITANLTSIHDRNRGWNSVADNAGNLGSQSPPGDITDTTIIITSNYIPTHPSTDIIDRTIESISRFIVLASDDLALISGTIDADSLSTKKTRIPMLITVDGLDGRKSGANSEPGLALAEYVRTLKDRYSDHPHFKVKILPQERNIKLIRNMQFALNLVTTKFIYVIQHDLPFIQPANHHAMVQFFEDLPETVRLIRFGRHATLSRSKDWPSHAGVDCGDELFLSSRHRHYGLNLSKTHTWSDK